MRFFYLTVLLCVACSAGCGQEIRGDGVVILELDLYGASSKAGAFQLDWREANGGVAKASRVYPRAALDNPDELPVYFGPPMVGKSADVAVEAHDGIPRGESFPVVLGQGRAVIKVPPGVSRQIFIIQ